MLHTFDGLDDWEGDEKCAGVDGYDDSLGASPRTDASAVGRRVDMENYEEPELETEHDALKRTLVSYFVYRRERGEIRWC